MKYWNIASVYKFKRLKTVKRAPLVLTGNERSTYFWTRIKALYSVDSKKGIISVKKWFDNNYIVKIINFVHN